MIPRTCHLCTFTKHIKTILCVDYGRVYSIFARIVITETNFNKAIASRMRKRSIRHLNCFKQEIPEGNITQL